VRFRPTSRERLTCGLPRAARRRASVCRIAASAAALIVSIVSASSFGQQAPPERAEQAPSPQGFSTWDVQLLYGSRFREPGVDQDVPKWTVTLENSSAWSWGSSYFFIDYLRSDSADQNATEFYGEWYPSASIGRMSGRDLSLGPLRDVSITMGFNAGSKSTGASPLVFLPGLTFDFKIPGFQFFSLGTFAYIDRGRFDGQDNGCNATTYQITPSWSLPFALGPARFRFDGFIDFIGSHGQCASQIVSQPTIKIDLGSFGGKPDRLFAGVEWAYWRNKYGISGFNQTAPQAVLMWVF
jgi:nucleoside-specific outer membrane channel protein Tsx